MNSLSLFSRYNPAERKLFFLSLSFSITPSTSALVVSPLMNNKSYLFACFLVTGRGSIFHPWKGEKLAEIWRGIWRTMTVGKGRIHNRERIEDIHRGETSEDLDKIRKNLPRQNCRRSNQPWNYASCSRNGGQREKERRERGTKFRLATFTSRIALPFRHRHTHTCATTHVEVAWINLVPHCHMPYSNPPILREMAGAFSFSTLDKLSPTFQSYFLHRVIRVRKSRILGATYSPAKSSRSVKTGRGRA